MKIRSLPARLAFLFALSISVASSSATVLSIAGNDTLVGNRLSNLITNGSFEANGGVSPNGAYWATGTGLSPTMSLIAWMATGQTNSYAIWGSDGFGGINNSAVLPDGTNGVYFGAGLMASVNPFPSEATNGLVTFASPPVIMPKPTDGPVTLKQTVSGLNPSATYVLDFWTSGEYVGGTFFPVDGFFGLDITGEARLFFAAPSGYGPIGTSQRYQVYFTPTNATITFRWINWGHYSSTNGISDELVLDDVILNLVSNAPTPIDCSCLTNITVTCPAVLPDLCALATNCFTTNMLPGSCVQNLPPGMPVNVGTYVITLFVQDLQSNTFSCPVTFTVNPPNPAPPLTVTCPTNKTVECGSSWDFDPPVVTSSCCGVRITPNDVVVSNSPCSQTITRTWTITDGCTNLTTCSQVVTLVDTTPPGTPCNGQNLVPNGDFERYTNCPSLISQLDYAAPWFTPTDASPDYYNSCAGVGSFVATPTNGVGVQVPLSGNGYAGAFVYSKFGTDVTNSYREYLEVPLITTLTPGQKYLVSFYVSRAEYYGQAVADIAAKFFPVPYVNYGPSNNLYGGVLVHPLPPEITNSPANVITDSTNWTLIQGIYTAVGWESHLVLGNFKDDPNTPATFVGGVNTNYAYYYFDDVSVVAICDPDMTNKVVQCGMPWEIPPFPIIDNCSGGNITVSNYTTTNGVCPKVVQRDWYLADACGNTNHLTQTVTIVDTNPPILLCAAGANLAPNPQFENFAFCPYYFSQVNAAGPWFNPTIATPDFLNACSTFWPVQVPNNLMGSQTPFSGNGYLGAFAYSVYGTNPVPGYREYIEAPLLAPLQTGMTYQVSFYVSLADTSGWSIANLGAHFSVGPLLNGGTQGPLNVVPQVANPLSNLLTNKTGWMLVQGTFTAAGNEDHITLGNFLSDAFTSAVTNASGTNHTYYYYDDIAVVPLCSFTNKTVACGEAWGFDTPLAFDTCSGTNVTAAVASTVTNSLCPLTVTRTWTLSDLCGNTNSVSQTVTVSNNAPLVVDCVCLQDASLELVSTNACVALIPDLSGLTNSPCITAACGAVNLTQSPPAGTVVGVGNHPITVTISDCLGNSNVCVLLFNVYPPQPIIVCPPNLTLYTCTNYAIANFAPIATGYTGTVVCSPPSGSAFPINTTTTVTCTATNSCGGSATCSFTVTVRPPHPKWACFTKVIGIITFPPPTGRIIYLPDFPSGGKGVDFENLGSVSGEGARFDLGPAEKFTFSTVLDFNAPEGASFALRLPPDAGNPAGTTWLSFRRTGPPPGRWDAQVNPQIANDPGAMFRSIAIGTNGKLFSSFTQNAASLATNDLLRLSPMAGATSAVLTVTLDCRLRELVLESMSDTASSSDRKGWDGCIYGNGPRGAKTNKTARVILTPLTPVISPPLTTVDLVASNLTSLAFDNPSLTMSGRKWGDGHVTLMKAYDDGAERGMEFFSTGAGGGVETELGHAASFSLRMTSLDTNALPLLEQQFAIRGWPPGTTTNRPPPPVINLRLAPNPGLGGVDVGTEFLEWGVSNVTIQLWDGPTLVAETNHVPATLAGSLVTLGGFPGLIGCPGIGVLSLTDTNPIYVTDGLACGPLGCVGTELRILAELSSTPPTAYTGLSATIGQEMDYLIHRLQTAPACTPVPLQVTRTANGVTLTWSGDGFHLQGAESVLGPWYDLGVESPATLPAKSSLRVFRLRCD